MRRPMHEDIRRDRSRRFQRARLVLVTLTDNLFLGGKRQGLLQYANTVSFFHAKPNKLDCHRLDEKISRRMEAPQTRITVLDLSEKRVITTHVRKADVVECCLELPGVDAKFKKATLNH
jgi:hypothetical protein